MKNVVKYEQLDGIARITFDDGKANAVGPAFLEAINAALDRAEKENATAVILQGREGMFSGGFDLGEFQKGPEATVAMVSGGFRLLVRLYSFPIPVVAACTGHGIALGAFILMASDYRIGTRGSFKFSLPETAIGMELPQILQALARARIATLHFDRVALMSEVYDPDTAVQAGFIDEIADASDLQSRCLEVATRLAQLPAGQYTTNKLALRAATLQTMRESIEEMLGN